VLSEGPSSRPKHFSAYFFKEASRERHEKVISLLDELMIPWPSLSFSEMDAGGVHLDTC
jgi:hypothetical protein